MKIHGNTRGLRNNNPGNIRLGKFRWKGEKRPSLDPEFCTFDSIEFGVAALYKLLRTYITKYHLTTVSDIISRYAPSSENNTLSYIAFCSDRVSFPEIHYDGLSVYMLMSAIMEYESRIEMDYKEIIDIVSNYVSD